MQRPETIDTVLLMAMTGAEGILLLTALACFIIGVVGWLSISEPDRSARLWMSAFIAAGISPLMGTDGSVSALSFLSGSLSMTVSFVLFGLSLKALYSERFSLRDHLIALGAGSVVAFWIQGYLFHNASVRTQATAFALINGAAATWATLEAVRLVKRTASRFAVHLTIIFSIQAVLLVMRIPQVWLGEATRLGGNDPITLTVVIVLALCGIVKAISYFALRFEELRNTVERDAKLVKEQALLLAKKNADLVSAMNAAPVACVVTDKALKIIYSNAQAHRLLGTARQSEQKAKLTDWFYGLRDANQIVVSATRYALLIPPGASGAIVTEISLSGVEGDSQSEQWVFLLKPTRHSVEVIEAIWATLPRRDDRTLLLMDHAGRTLSAQLGWVDVLGANAVFDRPEFSFDSSNASQSVVGLSLWETLTQFANDPSAVTRARNEYEAGRGTSFLIRDVTGNQINVGLIPILARETTTGDWLVEVTWKPAMSRPTPITERTSVRETKPSERPASPVRIVKSPDIPDFLKKQ